MNRNTVKTFTFLAGLAGLLVLAGQLVGGTGGAFLGLTLGLGLVGGSYWFSDRMAIRAAGASLAQLFTTHPPTERRVERLLATPSPVR